MARPPRFDTDQILDAAVRLAASAGPAGVTMSAVAQAIGAPSGSMYHRFPGRTALLAEVWLRTVERFQEGYFAALDSAPEPPRAAVAAARHVVSWSRAHPQEAALLLYGAEEFGRADWSEEHKERADLGNGRVFASLTSLAEALGATNARDHERITLALIDLPLSVVRRHLRAGQPLPPHAEDLAEECTAALLAVA
ncbi:TetR/AcrR family transcriptional regulator [Streptomyces sp. TRM66268-LWL]|uniref:TetR/AcrR family transcriptional regulator n=1 Tax=Streptomyces polyasparticus TaxID=2767826 RepID=A0ABR7SLD1_9ACTN|nr:TetR/AcrR family transcriptional regulator [Streptomyces polyasparticus]MBC9715138.1 TetR/AcrR family transcriptional regulator [Streptomyces polyasparticus]